MQCQSCDHTLIEKARFCDDCGESTARVDLDAESLKTYCSKCAATLRGTRKYCVLCGTASPHSGKFVAKKSESWIVNVLLDPRVQMAIVGSLLIIAALPSFTDVRYRFTSTLPFFEAYILEEPVLTRQRDHENFRIRPLVNPDEDGEKVRKPAGVARDSKGNLYVSDLDENVVYKIDAAGQKTVYAGTGIAGYSGDGAAAIRASLNRPRGLAIDDLDGLLIADSGNNVVRRVSAGGYITTVAGNATSVTDATGPIGTAQDAVTVPMMSPATVSADVDGTLYVTENPCEMGPRDPTVWVLSPKT